MMAPPGGGHPGQPPYPAAQQPPSGGQPPHPTAQQPMNPPGVAAQQRPGQPPAPAAQGLVVRGRVQDLQAQRQQVTVGGRVEIREPDRTIIQENGRTIIRHNEVDRFSFNAQNVQVQQRGQDTVTFVERPGGIRIVTVVDVNGRLLRRSRIGPDGREIVIIDNAAPEFARPDAFFVELPPPVLHIPREHYILDAERATEADIYAVLMGPPVDRLERHYSLDEIRYSVSLRDRMPRIDIDTVNFDTGSWQVTPDQVDRLAVIAHAIGRAITRNPQEVFLIEGHTDAVGSDVDNLSLSDRRAESVAMALSEQFQVPPENLTTQGYGKQFLKIPTDAPERQNRRVTVRRITPLLVGQAGIN